MPSNSISNSLTDVTRSASAPNKGDSNASKLPLEQIDRLAELIANGDFKLLWETEPSDRVAVLQRVAELRRKRLISFIAREIASDIRRSRSLGAS